MQRRDKEVSEGEDAATVRRGFIIAARQHNRLPDRQLKTRTAHAGEDTTTTPAPTLAVQHAGGFQGDGRRSRRYTNSFPFPPRVSAAEDSLSARR